jgi:hypothetical protein
MNRRTSPHSTRSILISSRPAQPQSSNFSLHSASVLVRLHGSSASKTLRALPYMAIVNERHRLYHQI